MEENGIIFKMKTEIFDKNLEDLSNKFFINFENILNKLSLENPNKKEIFIGLSGGSSIDKFYEKILENSNKIELSTWKKIRFCFLDERIVELDNIDSNYFQLKNKFLDKLILDNLILENQILKINLNSKNPQINYSSLIKKIDIAFFGSGPDSHIASLFPNHNLLENTFDEKYLLIENSPKSPSRRITISIKMIENIDFSFIFFIGDSKKEAFNLFNNKNISKKECPAKFILKSKNSFIVSNL